METITFKKLTEKAVIPHRVHAGDAGVDLFCCNEDGGSIVLNPGARGVFSTGIAVALPNKTVGLIYDKSGLATGQGLTVLGGVIDSGYRGEIKVCLLNTSDEIVVINDQQKIAQLLIQPIINPYIVVGDLPIAHDDRGEGGFGSTGLFGTRG